MKRDRVVAGWTRLSQTEVKVAIMAAAKTEPDLCKRLRLAIKTAAARRGVRRDLRDQFLAWISEAEVVLAVVAEAQSPAKAESPQAA